MGKPADLEKNWREYNPTTHLCGVDLNGQDHVVTIARIDLENVGDEKKDKPIVYFAEAGYKGMICGSKNSQTIAKLAKSNVLKDWIGLRIQIYGIDEKNFGQVKDVVRVRPMAPASAQKETLSPDHPKWYDAIKAIAEGRTTLEKVCGRYVITDEHSALINAEVSDIQKERAENA
jgi:hypothetical protein